MALWQQISFVFVSYYATAYTGLSLDAISGFAALVWPPTGIAIAATLLGGYRLTPGIFLAAVAVNLSFGAPLLVALGIGVGNALEAIAAAYLLQNMTQFYRSLERSRDVLALAICGAFISPLISASIGVACLWLGHTIEASAILKTWSAWWFGDAMGALVVTPPILLLCKRRTLSFHPPRRWEALSLSLSLLGVCLVIFHHAGISSNAIVLAILKPLIFPLLAWAALRFGPRGASIAVLVVSIFAIYGAYQNADVFGSLMPAINLLSAQTFVATAAFSTYLLAAVVTQYQRAMQVTLESETRLQLAKEEAEAANRSKSTFLANMSHEIRTPLTAIIGFTDLLLDPTISEAERAQFITTVQRNGYALTRLIDDILDLSKVDAGKLEIERMMVSLPSLIEDVVNLLGYQAQQKGLKLYTSIEANVPKTINSDPNRLRQILINIMGNAIKFTNQGSVSLVVKLQEASILYGHAKVAFVVSDTGQGMTPEQQSRLFKTFSQADSSTTRKFGGTGLGLVLSRRLAQLLNGDVVLSASELGIGSTFIISVDPGLPASFQQVNQTTAV